MKEREMETVREMLGERRRLRRRKSAKWTKIGGRRARRGAFSSENGERRRRKGDSFTII